MTHQHDKGYRSIFSNPRFFAELLKSCINEPWTAEIEPEDLEPVNATFILPAFEKREADIIYKLTLRDSSRPAVYCYCLMELQSSIDFSMPFRLLAYMVCLWTELLKRIPADVQSRKGFRLPVIIPVVLYNGSDRWTVPLEFAKLYEDIGALPEYQIQFKYHLIDVNRYSEAELLELKNLAGAVFYVDQKGDMKRKTAGLSAYLEALDYQSALTLLQWASAVVKSRLPEDGSGLAQVIEKYAAVLEQDKRRDMRMFVSNFAEEVELFMREEAETKKRLNIAEREKAQAQQRWAQSEREKAQSQQSFRQAVLLLKEMGISTENIAQKTGLSREEIEGIV